MLLEKDASDDVLINENRNYWYQVNLDSIPSAEIRSTFHQSAYDNETESFLDASLATSNSVCLQLYYSFAASILSLALTKTSINGILNRGGMFVFSHDQLKGFLGLPDDWSPIDKAVSVAKDSRMTSLLIGARLGSRRWRRDQRNGSILQGRLRDGNVGGDGLAATAARLYDASRRQMGQPQPTISPDICAEPTRSPLQPEAAALRVAPNGVPVQLPCDAGDSPACEAVRGVQPQGELEQS
ncbi:DREV methyltransferase, partial [Aphelenchoides avenae]